MVSISIYTDKCSYGDMGKYITVLIYIFKIYMFCLWVDCKLLSWINAWSALFWATIQYSNKSLDKIVVLAPSVSISCIGCKPGQTMYDFFGLKIGSMHLQMALNDPKSRRLNLVIPYQTKCKPLCCRDANGVGGGHGLFLCPVVLRSFVRHTIGVSAHLHTNPWWNWTRIWWLNWLWHFLGLIV